jgi:hypothetical protein
MTENPLTLTLMPLLSQLLQSLQVHHQNQLTHKQLNHLLNLLLNRLMLLDILLLMLVFPY